MDQIDPPLHKASRGLLCQQETASSDDTHEILTFHEELDLPLIDLSRLIIGDVAERESCKSDIARASTDWGFFQVINHGIPKDLLKKMREEQMKVFRQPFEKKKEVEKILKLSTGSYRWGTPTATCLKQLSWSEAFHVPMTDIYASGDFSNLSSTIEEFASKLGELAHKLAEILAEKLDSKSNFFRENCLPSTCYVRMNRYPPCPIPLEVFGLMPHTDSDFLTVLHQDDVGGLQLVKHKKWIAVKPNPDALIINIGDLFQAWSNDVYKSVEHRVVANPTVERFSTAYFLCPSYDAVVQSCEEPSVYRGFSFREYRQQVREDVQNLGHKVGLSRFLNLV